MSRRGTRVAGGLVVALGVVTAGLDLLKAVEIRWQTTLFVAALALVAGLATQRAIAVGQRRAEKQERDRVLDDALAWWPTPLVGEADPYELGAFPPGSGAYVDRDADVRLRQALAEPGYVLVVGPPGSGKSRAAFEALFKIVPRAMLLVPEDGESLGRLIAADPRLPGGEQGSVLWLDCVDRFLAGLRLDAVDRWVKGGEVRIVATITEAQRDTLLESGGPEGHIARRLFARAAVVSIDAELTDDEAAAAGAEFPDRDFSEGMTGAFRAGWQAPDAAPPVRFADAGEATTRQRPDLLLSVLLGGAVCVLGAIAYVAFDQGLFAPAPMKDQIADLRVDLAGCGLETFAGDEDNLPIIATVDAGRECEGHTLGAAPVLVYDKRDDRLLPVFDFGPPGEGFPQEARFGCRGDSAHPCWTDVTGEGDRAIIGVFRNPDTQALLPVAVWRDPARGWRVDPLLTEKPEVTKRFRAEEYLRPVDLGGGRPGYQVADFALVPSRPGDRSLPARAVIGFAPTESLLSPRRLEAQARPLRFDGTFGVGDECHVVRSGVPVEHLYVRVADGALADALRKRWERLENRREGICVLNR
jgi:hypothetical protein